VICPEADDPHTSRGISACNPGRDQGLLAQRTSVIRPASVSFPAARGARPASWWPERLDREGERDA
jgi:hypothetical protein